MKAPHVKIAPIVLAALVMVSPSYAQERAAAGATETQMTWSALRTLSDQANQNSKMAHFRIDQAVECGLKGMIYAPGNSVGPDKKCRYAEIDPTVLAFLTQIKTDVGSQQSKIESMAHCGSKGQVYNKSTNSCAPAFRITGGGQCITPEGGSRSGSDWTIRNPWGHATGCEGGTPRCNGSSMVNLGYGSDSQNDSEMNGFCKYGSANQCHTLSFICVQGI